MDFMKVVSPKLGSFIRIIGFIKNLSFCVCLKLLDNPVRSEERRVGKEC